MIQFFVSHWQKLVTALLVTTAVALTAAAADKLAIAEVQTAGQVDPAQVEGIAAYLETNVDGGYQLVTRAGLRAMLTELGFQNISDLADQKDELAQLNKVHGVKYLLVPTVSRVGTRYNLSMVVVDCATGDINAKQRATLVANDFDQLISQLDNTLMTMGLARPSTEAPVVAILLPMLKLKDAPDYLAEDFTAEMQSVLLDEGIKLVDRQVIDQIQAESNLTRFDLAAPGQFAKIGQLAVANYLVCPIIDRFGFKTTEVNVEYSGRNATKRVGNISGIVRIVETRTGNDVKVINFKKSMRATDIPIAERRDYEERDYDDALLAALMKDLAPKVAQALKPVVNPGAAAAPAATPAAPAAKAPKSVTIEEVPADTTPTTTTTTATTTVVVETPAAAPAPAAEVPAESVAAPAVEVPPPAPAPAPADEVPPPAPAPGPAPTPADEVPPPAPAPGPGGPEQPHDTPPPAPGA